MPRISVIIPVYKVEPYLCRCVDSILRQSFSDFELILVDDGSPDSCGAICDAYAKMDHRVHVIHQKNGGLSAARNAGLDWVFANSGSRWLAFVDSDDWVHRDYLELLWDAVQQDGAEMAMCGLLRTDRVCVDEPVDCRGQYLSPEEAYARYYGMCMTACCKLYCRELWRGIRFPEGKLHEDCYTTHLPLFRAGRIAVCDAPLYYYFANPGSITRMKWSEKRLQEIDAHEHRAAWLAEQGYEAAYRRETEVYVMTIYEQTEVLAKLSREEPSCLPHLKDQRKKLRKELNRARKMGLYAFEREYLWIYLMAYAPLQAWITGQKLRQKRNHR